MAVRLASFSPALLRNYNHKLRTNRFSKGYERSPSSTVTQMAHLNRGVSSQRVHALDPDNATVLVAGGGGVALDTVKLLRDMGAWTYMLQRSDTRQKTLEEMNVVVIKADALDKDTVNKQMSKIDGLDAVVSTLGGTPSDPQVDSIGNINVIQAALAAKVKRFVLVTSVGVGNSKDAITDRMHEILGPVLVEKAKAEDELKTYGEQMEYVIIRPGGLITEPATDCGVLTEDMDVSGRIHREDVAQLVIKALFSDSTRNKVLHAIDKNQSENRVHPERQLEVFEI
eukprot:g8178.t1